METITASEIDAANRYGRRFVHRVPSGSCVEPSDIAQEILLRCIRTHKQVTFTTAQWAFIDFCRCFLGRSRDERITAQISTNDIDIPTEPCVLDDILLKELCFSLSPREYAVICLYLRGHSNTEISKLLKIRVGSVDCHRYHAIRKMRAKVRIHN